MNLLVSLKNTVVKRPEILPQAFRQIEQWANTPNPCLSVYLTTAGVTPVTPIPFNFVNVDSASWYSLTTNEYTVRVAGNYLVAVSVGVSTGTGNGFTITAQVVKSGTVWREASANFPATSAVQFSALAVSVVPCVVGDTLYGGYVSSAGQSLAGDQWNYMEIAKVG